jgi:hypothetical protein
MIQIIDALPGSAERLRERIAVAKLGHAELPLERIAARRASRRASLRAGWSSPVCRCPLRRVAPA